MPLIIAQLLSEDSLTDLEAAVAAYKAGAGADLLDHQRAMASHEFKEPDGDFRISLLLFHGGLDVPTSTNKTADLQHTVVQANGTVADLQAAIDLALSDAVHDTVTDADTTASGTVTSATGPFEAEDVGRKIRIGSEVRTITAFTSANEVDYDNSAAAGGDFASGTGLTLDLLGAEVIQDAHIELYKSASGDLGLHALMALEGELP